MFTQRSLRLPKPRLFLLPLTAAILATTAIACGGESLDDIAPEATDDVTVDDNRFEPRVIEVPVGTTVVWTWIGSIPHNAVGDGWESPLQDEGSFEHVFDTAGSFDYECTLHPGTTGRVVVTP